MALPVTGGTARKTGALLGIAALHAAVFASLCVTAPSPSDDGGEAPVINLTLQPAPRFDSERQAASVAASSASRPRPAPPPAPAAASSRLRLRDVHAPAGELTPQRQEQTPQPASARASRRATLAPAPSTAERRMNPTDVGATASSDLDSLIGATQGGGGQRLGAAAAPDEDPYHAAILAWIERHKRPPGGRVIGIVTVHFVLDRMGAVHDIRLIRSSGSRALDLAALNQIRNTQPFPRPQPGTAWRTRPFTVHIDYRQETAS